MKVLIEYAVDACIDELDARDYALWDDWSREVVEVVVACQTSEGFFCTDALGRKIEVREEDQRRLGTPLLRNFAMELFEECRSDLRNYAIRIYEDEES